MTKWRSIMNKRGEIHSRVQSRDTREWRRWLQVKGARDDRAGRKWNNLFFRSSGNERGKRDRLRRRSRKQLRDKLWWE